MPKTAPEQNKALVLEAFDTLFNNRDYAAAEQFWSPEYIQHSAHTGKDCGASAELRKVANNVQARFEPTISTHDSRVSRDFSST